MAELEKKAWKFAEKSALSVLRGMGFKEEVARRIIEERKPELEAMAKSWAEEWKKSMIKYKEVVE